ncbi:unnamed protein product [Adineta ricciae]|uniref:Uncharacterized protein n=1 Tax=Adineta ricciae TaxID=249248 RepID=A0A813NNG3_ADIRI|nr:unnamed protein product [Adineta ricciae]CAF0744066.1 unnamed protein product [Adineta ricciae]
MDDMDTSLLNATQTNDVDSLKALLLSTANPTTYLNRLYNISESQICTLLMIACLNSYEELVCMLLDSFSIDLEVLNIVKINVNQQTLKVYENTTVLWVAAAYNNFNLIKIFVEHGAQVNHRIKTNSTPLRCVCYHGSVPLARYLIANGAEVRIKKERNDTNLILSVFREHVDLVHYLVDELGCDVNECDDEHRSSLYLAVERGSYELVEFLINRGARNLPIKYDRTTPLMLAAEKRRADLVNLIGSHCSIFEQIEAEELLGSAYACQEYGACNLQKTWQHLLHALQLRLAHQLPKSMQCSTHEVFQHRRECQTREQLQEIQTNHANLHIEALLVRERILGPKNFKYRHSLLLRGTTLVHSNQYQQGIALWMYTLQLQEQHAVPISSKQLRYLVKTFAVIIYKSSSVRLEDLCQLIHVTTKKLDQNSKNFDFDLLTLLFLITMTCKVCSMQTLDSNTNESDVFHRLIYSINRKQYATRLDGSTLLQLSLNEFTSSSDTSISRICKYPCFQTVRTLLQCGADIDKTDTKRNTALHIFVSNTNELDESIFQILCANHAHLDWRNMFSATPFDLISDVRLKQILQVKTQLKLKCLCARLIQKCHLPFREVLTHSLVTFVERH